ncbi:MAG: DNA-binding response regulator [Betaproteobacteria bacterium RIFCSPLOWO2_12_FULL_63_13]|nr:MAG: DNA-binding response regulator [Betaproteobacteria bacterium RIFCSPLOWO2_12_FULL_63_13]
MKRSADDRARLRVLVVEDEEKVASALQEGLDGEGYDAVIARTGEDAFFLVSTEAFDVVLLDLTLPGRDGFQILAALRQQGRETRVLVLTARDALEDRVKGLDGGADDYLVKPFAFAELLARIRAMVRRGRVTAAPRLAAGDLEMDLWTRKVSRAGRAIDLTTREFELLEHLLRFEGQVVSRETLAREVWREKARTLTLDNVIDTHVARLRKKVDADQAVKLIHTIRGVGFMIREGEV